MRHKSSWIMDEACRCYLKWSELYWDTFPSVCSSQRQDDGSKNISSLTAPSGSRLKRRTWLNFSTHLFEQESLHVSISIIWGISFLAIMYLHWPCTFSAALGTTSLLSALQRVFSGIVDFMRLFEITLSFLGDVDLFVLLRSGPWLVAGNSWCKMCSGGSSSPSRSSVKTDDSRSDFSNLSNFWISSVGYFSILSQKVSLSRAQLGRPPAGAGT